MNNILINRILLPLSVFFVSFLPAACGGNAASDVAASVDDAEQALADGQPEHAARVCADLMANYFDRLDENQLGRIAIVFMKLPESENSDENVADAIQCVRQAWKLSDDSLRGFYSTLSPEDVPHFVMLTRISGSIDFPPDLSEEHYVEDSIHANL